MINQTTEQNMHLMQAHLMQADMLMNAVHSCICMSVHCLRILCIGQNVIFCYVMHWEVIVQCLNADWLCKLLASSTWPASGSFQQSPAARWYVYTALPDYSWALALLKSVIQKPWPLFPCTHTHGARTEWQRVVYINSHDMEELPSLDATDCDQSQNVAGGFQLSGNSVTATVWREVTDRLAAAVSAENVKSSWSTPPDHFCRFRLPQSRQLCINESYLKNTLEQPYTTLWGLPPWQN